MSSRRRTFKLEPSGAASNWVGTNLIALQWLDIVALCSPLSQSTSAMHYELELPGDKLWTQI
jgi:hypothetical protein